MALLTIGGVEIGGDNPCRFVAEVGANHNGSYDTAYNLVRAARSCGADFIKFQAYTMDEIIGLRGDGPAPEPWARYGTLRQLYERAITPLDWLPSLFAYARKIGLVPFASVFGAESGAALEALDCPAYKIARYDNGQAHLLDAVYRTGKTMLVSAARHQRAEWFADDVVWLYCPPGYPAVVEWLPTFDARDFLGLSSHCLDPFLPIAAVSRGAKLLEYHLQLDDVPAELDGSFSLTAHQFGQMVASVRQTERLLA